jgi:hypothetical protein
VNPSSAHAYDIRGLTFYSSNGFWVRSGASARFEDVRFSAPDPFSDAAIWVQSGNLTVSMCEFVNISSFMNGGGISQDIGTLNVNNSSFKNSFAGDAGGIYTRAQNPSIIGHLRATVPSIRRAVMLNAIKARSETTRYAMLLAQAQPFAKAVPARWRIRTPSSTTSAALPPSILSRQLCWR